MDVLYLALAVLFLVLTIGLAAACNKLGGGK